MCDCVCVKEQEKERGNGKEGMVNANKMKKSDKEDRVIGGIIRRNNGSITRPRQVGWVEKGGGAGLVDGEGGGEAAETLFSQALEKAAVARTSTALVPSPNYVR